MANRDLKAVIDQVRKDRSSKFVSAAELDALLDAAEGSLRGAPLGRGLPQGRIGMSHVEFLDEEIAKLKIRVDKLEKP